MPRLDIYSDVICPWCYIGKAHLQGALDLLARENLTFEIGWRAFQLNPEMRKGGVARAEYRRAKFGSTAQSDALDAKVGAAAEAAGLAIRFDLMTKTPNTFDAHRLIRWSEPQGRQNDLVDRLFAAYFVQGRDIGDQTVLAALAGEAGLDAAEATRFLAGDEAAAEVAAEENAVRQAGIDAVPTFVMEQHVLFSGAVPSDVFAEALTKAHAVIVGRAA